MDPVSGTLGKDDFLKLFTTQLRFQDPLNPLDSTDFTAQLAQFSSLEQLFNMNASLQDILTYQGSLNNAMAVGLIGRVVKVDGDSFTLAGTADLEYALADDAASVTITIQDEEGNVVATIDAGAQQAGEQSFCWDGTGDDGLHLPDGDYTFSVTAVDGNGENVEVETSVTGTVTGITFDSGVTYLVLDNGMQVSLGEIMEVYQQGGA